MSTQPSKSQVNKAGRLLRKMHRGERLLSWEEFRAAMDVLLMFRASHSAPLAKANNGLRSMLVTANLDGRPTQRLKRVRTIIDKLVRQPTMALANMQDIGGCRVVCADISQLRQLEERVRLSRPPRFEYDYICNPKPSGYRGLHLVVTYDERLIEIQLRTGPMHDWAVTQERIGTRLGVDLKSSVGPPEVLKLMELLSQAMALEEQAESVDQKLANEIKRARQLALSLLKNQMPGR